MRRWIAIVLLALLPFQFTWAGAGHFCAHADGTAASLSVDLGGTDVDSPAPATDDAEPAQTPAQPELQAGCDQCPCHAFGLLGATLAQHANLRATPCFESVQEPAADALQAQPERPQWAVLA